MLYAVQSRKLPELINSGWILVEVLKLYVFNDIGLIFTVLSRPILEALN
jgi:hypothetical protein